MVSGDPSPSDIVHELLASRKRGGNRNDSWRKWLCGGSWWCSLFSPGCAAGRVAALSDVALLKYRYARVHTSYYTYVGTLYTARVLLLHRYVRTDNRIRTVLYCTVRTWYSIPFGTEPYCYLRNAGNTGTYVDGHPDGQLSTYFYSCCVYVVVSSYVVGGLKSSLILSPLDRQPNWGQARCARAFTGIRRRTETDPVS